MSEIIDTILVVAVSWAIFRIERVATQLDELDERFKPRED
ncbi:hypothetical protein J2R95_003156 [Bradyrhizobium japonicum]|nr:hypothetical protein [Bradyrhizobium japonicum]